MPSFLKLPLLGVFAAIAITTTMDASGLVAFSALPLFPLMLLFGYLGRFSRAEMGFAWGQWNHYALAALYPVVVLGLIALSSAAAGAIDTSKAEWPHVWRNLALLSVSTFIVAIITEEGFFRGWLWASLVRAGQAPARVLIYSSIAFAVWHLSAVLLDTGFNPPPTQIPVYIVNAAVMGAIWGLLRGISGSVLVASLAHAAETFAATGKQYPETVVLRLIDAQGRPEVKIAASEEGAGLSFVGIADTTQVQLAADKAKAYLRLKNEDGRQQELTP